MLTRRYIDNWYNIKKKYEYISELVFLIAGLKIVPIVDCIRYSPSISSEQLRILQEVHHMC